MITRTIRLDGRELAYTLTRSSRRRTIGLKVGADGVSVVLPARAGPGEADRALREKSDWVLKRLARAEARAALPVLEGRSGEAIGWLGGELVLQVSGHARARTLVERGADTVIVRVDERLDGPMKVAAVRRALHRWRKTEALELMAPKTIFYAERLGARRPKVSVREQTSRWGSCSADGSIRLNARLIAFPETMIDYVCAHEACHLLEMNHSARFHALLDSLMPGHRQVRRDLRAFDPPGVSF